MASKVFYSVRKLIPDLKEIFAVLQSLFIFLTVMIFDFCNDAYLI